MNELADIFDELVGRVVVLDVASPYVFVGTLAGHGPGGVTLENADVHDLRDTNATRELYLLESKQHGVRANRKRVFVRRDEIVSISLLDDVVD